MKLEKNQGKNKRNDSEEVGYKKRKRRKMVRWGVCEKKKELTDIVMKANKGKISIESRKKKRE